MLLKMCGHPGCRKSIPITEKFCERHQKPTPSVNIRKGTFKRMYDRKWQKCRLAYLKEHPICVECERQGIFTAATQVDHIKPHNGNYELFWNSNNWQALCKSCHSKKTAREDGGFGNKPR